MTVSIETDNTIPVWDNTQIYSSLEDRQIDSDCNRLGGLIAELNHSCERLASGLPDDDGVSLANQTLGLYSHTYQSLSTLHVYASCIGSVDTANEAATRLSVQVEELDSQLDQAFRKLKAFILDTPDRFRQKLFRLPEAAPFDFYFTTEQKRKVHDLTVKEEVAVSALSTDGLHSWGRLYTELSGSLRCQVDGEEMGLASAFNLTCQADAVKRKQAWQGIQAAWRGREETAAAILNAINGWRHQEQKLRSAIKPLHYLDVTCHEQRMEQDTLATLMRVTEQRKSLGHRALKGMAKGLGVEQLGPQDLLAPCPKGDDLSSTYHRFDQALALVAGAFDRFDPEMGDFARMMYNNGWIDAKPTPHRRTGAYCTLFASVREPRVFMTWDGSAKNVITLAHELGHAWHNWVMKDMPYFATHYPSTLAETASIFAETLVREALSDLAGSDQEKLEIAWEDAERAAAFLLNIPARFEFEKRMVEARAGSYLPASELSQIMTDSWAKWYGDSISEYDPMFWASKLHFSISGMSFYNYPYLFGYLFSLGVYAQKDRRGEQFRGAYIEILKDTGRMTSEALIEKHLGKDIRQPQFWNESLDIVEGLIQRFESLLEKVS